MITLYQVSALPLLLTCPEPFVRVPNILCCCVCIWVSGPLASWVVKCFGSSPCKCNRHSWMWTCLHLKWSLKWRNFDNTRAWKCLTTWCFALPMHTPTSVACASPASMFSSMYWWRPLLELLKLSWASSLVPPPEFWLYYSRMVLCDFSLENGHRSATIPVKTTLAALRFAISTLVCKTNIQHFEFIHE